MIESYSDLQTAVANWLDRTDLTARIPEFIQLTEAKLRRKLRRRSVRDTITLTSGVDSVTLPADVAELRSIRLVTSSYRQDVPLLNQTPEMLAERRAAWSQSGRPRFFSVVGNRLLLVPTPDDNYSAEIIYYEALQPLSDTNPTNNVLTEAPDVYLYGALQEAEPYLENDERLPLWKAQFEAALHELTVARQREEYSASLRPVRLPRVFG